MTGRRAVRTLTAVTVAIVSVLLIAGCTRVTGGNSSPASCSECSQLLAVYPWLEQLGLSELWDLVQQYGPDVLAILAQALVALAG